MYEVRQRKTFELKEEKKMVLKRIFENSTVLYISKSTVDAIGFEGVLHNYVKEVPKDTEVKGLNMSVFGCPDFFKTKYGDMIAVEFMTTEKVFDNVETVESI